MSLRNRSDLRGNRQGRDREWMIHLLKADGDDKITLCLPENELNIQQEMEENEALCAETVINTLLVCLPDIISSAHSHNELRKLLEEERASTVSPLPNEGLEVEAFNGVDKSRDNVAGENEYIVEESLEKVETRDEGKVYNIEFPFPCETEEDDEESRIRRGKGNIEKWMQFLLENTQEDAEVKTQTCGGKEASRTDEVIEKINKIYPLTDIKDSMPQKTQCTVAWDISDENSEGDKENGKCMANINTPYRAVPQKITAKERGLARSESTQAFRRIPSSPSLLLEGMKKRVGCMVRRKSFTKS